MVFPQCKITVVSCLASASLKGEQRPALPVQSEEPAKNESTGVDQCTINKSTVDHSPAHLDPNFEQSEPHQSTHQCFKSDWKRRLQADEGTVALADENIGEHKGNKEAIYVMVAETANAKGLNQTMVNEAKA